MEIPSCIQPVRNTPPAGPGPAPARRSLRLWAPALLALIVAVFALAAPRAQGASPHTCGSISGEVGITDLFSKGTGCAHARVVAESWLRKVLNRDCTRFDCRVKGFRCRAERPARVYYPVNCRKDTTVVRWRVFAD